MEVSWAKRKSDAVAAHGSKANSRCRGSSGGVDLTEDLVLEDTERCLASPLADMADSFNHDRCHSVSSIYRVWERNRRLILLLQEAR